MKLLLDFNLSPKLVPLLGGLFPGTIHADTTDLPVDAEDIAIWEYAKRENFAILTADSLPQLGESSWPTTEADPVRGHELSYEEGGIYFAAERA